MANTGKKIILTLKQVDVTTGDPTGVTKPNTPGDPDYVESSEDLVACPISYSTACPTLYFQSAAGAILYEFSLPNAVLNNPAIAKVAVMAQTGGVIVLQDVYPFPHSNYFNGDLSLPSGQYMMILEYRNAADAVVATCPQGLQEAL